MILSRLTPTMPASSPVLVERILGGGTTTNPAWEPTPMRYQFIAIFAAVLAVTAAPISRSALAEDAPKDVKGLYLMSDYPAVTLRPGETSTINLKLQNYDLPPERLGLSVSGVPSGWTATLMGGGQPVAAAMPATNSSVALELRLDVPKNAAIGTETLTVTAAGGSTNAHAADRGHARQGSAGQADADAATSRTARHLEVELRVSARHQERQRQEAHREPVGADAAEFRRLVHGRHTAARNSTPFRSMPARPRT